MKCLVGSHRLFKSSPLSCAIDFQLLSTEFSNEGVQPRETGNLAHRLTPESLHIKKKTSVTSVKINHTDLPAHKTSAAIQLPEPWPALTEDYPSFVARVDYKSTEIGKKIYTVSCVIRSIKINTNLFFREATNSNEVT